MEDAAPHIAGGEAAALVADLVDLLDVEELDTDLYRGRRARGGIGRVFGGQVIAQALQAAQRSTVDGKVAHSLHAYFMRPGSEEHPIVYRVVRDFDGGSFATRRIIAIQRGRPILNMAASFQRTEIGLSHQDAMPDVPAPETLTDETVLRRAEAATLPEEQRRWLLRPRAIEQRPVNPRPLRDAAPETGHAATWFRAAAPLPDDPATHRAVLAYASDMALLGTALRPHPVGWLTPGLQGASLDHAVWLHQSFRADEWLLHVTDSPWAGQGRGFNHGQIYTRDGRLVASTAQEGLIRLRRPS